MIHWLSKILVCLLLTLGAAHADTEEWNRADLEHLSEIVGAELQAGIRSSERHLSAVGPEVSHILAQAEQLDDFKYMGFSTSTRMELLYRLAELQQPEQGNLFLAKIARVLQQESSAAATEQKLNELVSRYTGAELDEPLRFADPALLRPEAFAAEATLPSDVIEAIDLLAQYAAPNEIGSLRAILERTLNLDRFENPRSILDRSIQSANGSRDFLVNMFATSGIPPSLQSAVLETLNEVQSMSSSASVDTRVIDLARRLASVGSELPNDSNHLRILEVQDKLSSRQMQMQLSTNTSSLPTFKDATAPPFGLNGRGTPDDGGSILQSGPESPSGGPGNGPTPRPTMGNAFASMTPGERFASYMDANFHPSGSSGGSSATSPGGGVGPVTRSYQVAIRSPFAARGVAVGAELFELPPNEPNNAFWMPNDVDPRIGRLAVTLEGTTRLAVSDTLFFDSFLSAYRMLSTTEPRTAAFNEGDISVVMSMDPTSRAFTAQIEEVYQSGSLRQLTALLPMISSPLGFVLTGAQSVAIEFDLRRKVPTGNDGTILRPIVLHPGVEGSELSWSATRVDFWFRNIALAIEEGSEILPARSRPTQSTAQTLINLRPHAAETWQWYETSKAIRFTDVTPQEVWLEVVSASCDEARDDSNVHFAISLFSFSQPRPGIKAVPIASGRAFSLPKEEAKVCPLTYWLFANHPDFVRLNDFSESLTILRWLRETRTPITLVGVAANTNRILSPDAVNSTQVFPEVFSGSEA